MKTFQDETVHLKSELKHYKNEVESLEIRTKKRDADATRLEKEKEALKKKLDSFECILNQSKVPNGISEASTQTEDVECDNCTKSSHNYQESKKPKTNKESSTQTVQTIVKNEKVEV